ncbi:MAG TPA: hypothetical protein VLA83_06865 [Candidatus Binatia bacterium]|nr:hypothetical protein [Candidatus Binatia bacterium]
MMSNPNRLISLLALILLFNLTALAQQQSTDSQANQDPQQPADKNSRQSQQPQADQSNKDQQQPAENKKQAAENKAGTNPQQPEGWEGLGYVVHQTIETGYRVSDVSGSKQMYNTLVNLPQGPRLLEQSLSMQSPAHQGVLFDNLFINSFGWGGDPYNAFNARADKSNLYDFRMTYRKDDNNFDYNLLANPLNPPDSTPSIPVTASPHNFSDRRRMSDYDLTIKPQAAVVFRVGYSRNNMTGPSFSSVHEGTDALLFQQWNTTLNTYRFGADFKLWPHLVLSYDQSFDYYKGDTQWQLAPFAQAFVPGAPGVVDLGLPIDTGNKNPCAPVAPATSLIDGTRTLTNLSCNAFFAYTRPDHVRTSMPTERISLHTDYFQRIDLNASYAYSSADTTAPLNEFFNGLISRTRTRQTTVTGLGEANRITNVADFSATVHLTKHFRLVDTYRFWAYRIPETGNFVETDFNVPGSGSCSGPTCSLLTPISSTTPNVTDTLDQLSFNQNWWRNETDLVWDASKHYGGRIGFRYGHRTFTHILAFSPVDEDQTQIHEYTSLAAFWVKPMNSLRFNFDWEHTSNDETIVRIGPRAETRYRFQANYTPRPWAVLGGTVNVWDSSNGDFFTKYRAHNRNYGFIATLSPRQRFGFDLAYNYTNYFQSAFICFNDSATTLLTVANAGSCVTNGFNDSDNPLLIDGRYNNNTHYGMAAITFKPVPKWTTQLGYSVTSVGGQAPQFNILQPLGPLQYNYHQPLANVAVALGHNLTAKAGWNYYQYGEKSFIGPALSRYFHANNETLSLAWAF